VPGAAWWAAEVLPPQGRMNILTAQVDVSRKAEFCPNHASTKRKTMLSFSLFHDLSAPIPSRLEIVEVDKLHVKWVVRD
jgi:hypothetical protein